MNFKKNITESISRDNRDFARVFAKDYCAFLTNNKIERDCVETIIDLAKRRGYKEYVPGKRAAVPIKGYINNRGKSCILYSLNTENEDKGFHMIVSHLDSPRIDLKPNALYEEKGQAFFKSHYYGGIKTYQWTTIPYEMRGTIYLKDGSKIDCKEAFSDKTFTINDIQAHLSDDQDNKKTKDAISAEELNIIIGTETVQNLPKDESDGIKKNILNILQQKYNIEELDLYVSEIQFVPKFDATFVGLDESLVGGYGQDDKVCAYTALMAEFYKTSNAKSTFIIFADKEEIGSECTSGMQSNWWVSYLQDLCKDLGLDYNNICRKSVCLSADVTGAFDPTFADAFEENNACYLNKGIAVTKCVGGTGKYDSNETDGEVFNKFIRMLQNSDRHFQINQMGKLGRGGGGTVAQYTARNNIETIDAGVPTLNMHSPFELTSVYDIYETYNVYKLFLESFT